MPDTDSQPDVTIRGGLVNFPASSFPTPPPRHQPDTPRNKKPTTTKPDHQVYGHDSTTTPKRGPGRPRKIPDEPPPAAAAPPVPPPDEPETDSPD